MSQCDGVNFKYDLNISTCKKYKLCSTSQAFSSFLMKLCAKKNFCLFCRNTERCEIKPPKKEPQAVTPVVLVAKQSNNIIADALGPKLTLSHKLTLCKTSCKMVDKLFLSLTTPQMTRLTVIISAIRTSKSSRTAQLHYSSLPARSAESQNIYFLSCQATVT